MFHSKNVIASFFVFGCLNAAACAGPQRGWTVRGSVLTRAPETRAITSGPAQVHAYSGFSGGEIYTITRTNGSNAALNADCSRAQIHDGVTPIVVTADRVVSVVIGEGQVACLRTWVNHSYELLWHGVSELAVADRAPAVVIAKVTEKDGR